MLLVVVPLIGVVVASNVGDALTTTWAEEHPLALTLLNARNRILVLVTNQLDPVSFYLAAGFRLVVADPLFFVIGRWYGDAAVQWLERRSPSFGEQARLLERAFAKAAYPLLVVAPNAWVCLFAGAGGMAVGIFVALNLVGTGLRLYLIRRLGEAFEAPIGAILGFFADYRWPLLALSVGLVALVYWNDRRRGKDEIGALLELGEEAPPEPGGSAGEARGEQGDDGDEGAAGVS